MESFHASLKKDLIYRRSWPTRRQARTAIFDYVETFYNRQRRHSTLGMLSPVDYEAAHRLAIGQLPIDAARAGARAGAAKKSKTVHNPSGYTHHTAQRLLQLQPVGSCST